MRYSFPLSIYDRQLNHHEKIRVLSTFSGISAAGILKHVVGQGSEGDRRRQYEEIIASQAEAVIKIPPGLQRHLELPMIWQVAFNGVFRPKKRSGVAVLTLPEACPLTLDELLDPSSTWTML